MLCQYLDRNMDETNKNKQFYKAYTAIRGLVFFKFRWFCIAAHFCAHFKECSLQFIIFVFLFCLSVVHLYLFLNQKNPRLVRLPLAKFLLLILPGGFPIKYKSKNQPLAHVAAIFCFCLHFFYLFVISTSNHPSAPMFVYYFDVASFICI